VWNFERESGTGDISHLDVTGAVLYLDYRIFGSAFLARREAIYRCDK
jgi:hypothetical protein